MARGWPASSGKGFFLQECEDPIDLIHWSESGVHGRMLDVEDPNLGCMGVYLIGKNRVWGV